MDYDLDKNFLASKCYTQELRNQWLVAFKLQEDGECKKMVDT